MTDEWGSADSPTPAPAESELMPLTIGRRSALAAAIYGQIVTTSVVVALELDEQAPAAASLAAVLVTVVIFWLAHVYAEGLAGGLDARHVRDLLIAEAPMVLVALPTAFILLLGVVGVFSREHSVTVAIVIGLATLLLLGAIASLDAGHSRVRGIVTTLLGVAFGLVLVVLKVFVH